MTVQRPTLASTEAFIKVHRVYLCSRVDIKHDTIITNCAQLYVELFCLRSSSRLSYYIIIFISTNLSFQTRLTFGQGNEPVQDLSGGSPLLPLCFRFPHSEVGMNFPLRVLKCWAQRCLGQWKVQGGGGNSLEVCRRGGGGRERTASSSSYLPGIPVYSKTWHRSVCAYNSRQ